MYTGELIERAGITPHQLRGLILSRKVPRPPVRAGRYDWPADAVEQVRQAVVVDLRRRPKVVTT